MNTVNFNDKAGLTDSTLIGVDNNQMVVTIRPQNYGTFVVSTADSYTRIPYQKARNFRINNFSGKIVGVRRAHKRLVVDRFEDTEFSNWAGSGTIQEGTVLEGTKGAEILGLKYTALTTEQMNDGSEVEVTFVAGGSSYSIDIRVWDNAARVTSGDPAASFTATPSNTIEGKEYRLIFRLFPTTKKYDTYLEGDDGRITINQQITGEFGTNDMKDSVISIDSNEIVNVDPIIYQQKVNYPHELVLTGSTLYYPCEDNLAEYEVVNLGSDAKNYNDTNEVIQLTGLYSS